MTSLTEFIPTAVKTGSAALVSVLVILISSSKLATAFKTGVVQRLSTTRKYRREENPAIFWSSVVFYAAAIVVFTGMFVIFLWRLMERR